MSTPDPIHENHIPAPDMACHGMLRHVGIPFKYNHTLISKYSPNLLPLSFFHHSGILEWTGLLDLLNPLLV